MSPLGALGRGLAAGAAGTALMTGYQTAAAVRRGSSLTETVAPEPPGSWSDAPAPAQVGYRFLRGLFEAGPSPRRANVLTNLVHWSYGGAWGAAYGIVAGSAELPVLRAGAALGTLVFASAYVALPAMGLYQPPWRYRPGTLALDWSYHLVYGAGVAVCFRLLEP